MKEYGLIGKILKHSFSPNFFNKKFSVEQIDAKYYAIELEDISLFPKWLQNNNYSGLNVTIPYKESIIPFLDNLDETAAAIGAVNCIQFKNGKRIGFNTDIIGFVHSLKPLLEAHHNAALILGTGGASKAVQVSLRNLNIPFVVVSRTAKENGLNYEQLNESIIEHHKIIINTTPLGMHPDVESLPALPYQYVSKQHLLYDLVYNPSQTAFLSEGKKRGATIKNGLEMLELQALAAWEIWNA